MNKLFLICVLLCGTGSSSCYNYNDDPNIRVIPGVELCGQACDKLKALDVKHGDEDCKIYYEDITVDGKVMDCKGFCEYQMSNSVQLNTSCLLNEVEICSVDIPAKCGL
jgi:hypothetical protein